MWVVIDQDIAAPARDPRIARRPKAPARIVEPDLLVLIRSEFDVSWLTLLTRQAEMAKQRQHSPTLLIPLTLDSRAAHPAPSCDEREAAADPQTPHLTCALLLS